MRPPPSPWLLQGPPQGDNSLGSSLEAGDRPHRLSGPAQAGRPPPSLAAVVPQLCGVAKQGAKALAPVCVPWSPCQDLRFPELPRVAINQHCGGQVWGVTRWDFDRMGRVSHQGVKQQEQLTETAASRHGP